MSFVVIFSSSVRAPEPTSKRASNQKRSLLCGTSQNASVSPTLQKISRASAAVHFRQSGARWLPYQARQVPDLVDRQHGTFVDAMPGAPGVDLRLGAEGQHGAAVVEDVVPGAGDRHAEVDEEVGLHDLAVPDVDLHCLGFAAQGGGDGDVFLQEGGDSQGAPCAVAPPGAALRGDPEVGGP